MTDYPKNTSEVLMHMGYKPDIDFDVIDRMNGSPPEVIWKGTTTEPTVDAIVASVPSYEAEKTAKIALDKAKRDAMPTYDELVSRVIALEAKTGIILTK